MLRLTKSETVAMPVKLRLPTDNPNSFNEGTITCKVKIISKDRMRELSEKDTTDAEYLDLFLVDVDGLGDEDAKAINGDAALTEVRTGQWSTFLQAAILQAYFEQYGDARVKNSKPSRGR
ncbi:hypothetical protein ABFU56_02920 [Xanthomonas campestris pv. campestris]|jgi:hypothetical protein|uniref:hypothetical protein n=1 Tax=Xanthomonas campestris TaxID=339 RepID=UPI0005E9DD6B|nr:hypothetical protein [Xanthomonas campestris]MEA9746624.1 hypothetical protein [Xanthomonas campestris pv. raphani]MEA9846580.1 hypothetical protein [Xanthomonas campestris pv. raphani]MEA9927472.1 hypothetical protein [Xanthomonas campestris pv. raphani]RFF50698.1 hypothetical protein D0A35_09615 [Xanthomonas campestris]CEM56775.1 hypothetical protein XCCB1459_0548 [Xanthomonas campestris pv. campestris]